jgi:hypothetical protein
MGRHPSGPQKDCSAVVFDSPRARARHSSIPILVDRKITGISPPSREHVIAPQPTQYFSKSVRDITDEELILRVRRLPILAKKTVDKLLASSRQYWLDGVQSVVYSHLGGAVTHFPLWFLTYWATLHDIKRDAWVPWRNCQAWVNRQKNAGKRIPTVQHWRRKRA